MLMWVMTVACGLKLSLSVHWRVRGGAVMFHAVVILKKKRGGAYVSWGGSVVKS